MLRGLRRGAGSSQLQGPLEKQQPLCRPLAHGTEGWAAKPCPSGMPTASKEPGQP